MAGKKGRSGRKAREDGKKMKAVSLYTLTVDPQNMNGYPKLTLESLNGILALDGKIS